VALGLCHHGMAEVMPIGARLPSGGHTVTVRFAAPVRCDDAFVQQLSPHGDDPVARASALTDWAEATLVALERQVRDAGPFPGVQGHGAGGDEVTGNPFAVPGTKRR